MCIFLSIKLSPKLGAGLILALMQPGKGGDTPNLKAGSACIRRLFVAVAVFWSGQSYFA
jgi:hypothetical protein